MVAIDNQANAHPRRTLIGAGVLLGGELALIGTIFKHGIDFSCLDNWPAQACGGASGILVALYCVFGASLLYWMLRPTPVRTLVSEAGHDRRPLALNILGTLLCLVPIGFLHNGVGRGTLYASFAFWGIGMASLLAGLALFLAPLQRWHRFLQQEGLSLAPVFVAGALAPWLATQIRPLWRLDNVAQVTFDAVSFVVRSLGYEVGNPPGTKLIGTEGFAINIAPVCSGVEGIALVTVFVSIYLWLFRKDLRFPRVFWLYPIGLMTSALFNVIRISVLLIIGLEGNPELAVGGFHSHAGWLMFTLIALGIVAAAHTVPALQKAPSPDTAARPALMPLLQDPLVAKILPFAIFMLSALFSSAFTQNPSVVYPLRVVAMGAVLALFWSYLRALPWRLDPVAMVTGVAIGLLWVMIPVGEQTGPAPYGELTDTMLILWFILRGIGTVALVPVIEELFFRDYLEHKLRLGTGYGWKTLAAIATAGLFAALHDRWAEAFVAGLVFSWVMQRRRTVIDAIIAHAAANALVYGVALATGNLNIL